MKSSNSFSAVSIVFRTRLVNLAVEPSLIVSIAFFPRSVMFTNESSSWRNVGLVDFGNEKCCSIKNDIGFEYS